MGLAAQSRAVQEVQAALVVAKQFPRDVNRCVQSIKVSCGRPKLASQALYAYAKGGSDISGPSIRLAEAIAQHWGNLDFGFRETDRGTDDGVGWSDVQTFCWDMQSNVRRTLSFRLRHWRDTRKGGYKLEDEREIYELMANMAQRRVRACILAVIPGDVVEEAEAECQATLRADADTSPEAIKKLIEAFGEFKVTKGQIEIRLQRKLDAITPGQVVQLRKIFTSIRDGIGTVTDWFDDEPTATGKPVDPFADSKADPKPENQATKPEEKEEEVI